MRRRINPNQVVLGMMARGCPECNHVQHVWFANTEEFDNWKCPVCAGRIEPDEEKELLDNPDEPDVE